MSDITLRLVKGSPLTNQEVDDNFANLNTDKYQAGDSASFQDVTLDNMAGPITWNVDDGTVDVPLNAQVTLQLGQEFVFYAKATEAIANGDVVMFAGAQGGHLLIAKCDMGAVGFDPSHIVGVATQSFAINDFGYVTSSGKVRGIDTSGFAEGTVLYVDPTTAGGFTSTKPAPPNHVVQIAAVTNSHATQGTILTRVSHMPDTDEVPEGSTNLYFTDARAVSAIKADGDWNATNWDTAYGWGDHSTEGYLTSIPYPSSSGWWNGYVGVGGDGVMEMGKYMDFHTSNTGGSADYDLRVTASPGVFSVGGQVNATGGNSGQWNTAYGWGDHSTQSYATQTYVNNAVSNLVDSAPATLDTLNELAAALGDDPNFAATVTNSIGTKWTQDNTKISNWDTAYSWGNHASAGYLTSFDITTQTDAKYLRSDVVDTTSSRIDFRAGITSQTLDIGYTGDRTIQALSNDLTFGTYGDLHLQHYGGDLHMVHGGGIMYDNGNRVFSDRYHPNADKWTTTRTNTVTLSGDVTGSGSASVDGTGNWTVSIPAVVTNDSHSHSNYMLRGNAAQTGINSQLESSAYRFDPSTDNPTNEHYAVLTYGNQANVVGQLATHFVNGATYNRAYNSSWSAWSRMFDDDYHPNADKWTTARTNTVTLTGDASGSGSASVDGTGNWTVSVPVVVNNDSHNHDHSDGNFTINGGLTVSGNLARGTYESLSQYHTGADNIVLKGNSVGRSGIFFESEKDGVNINHPSDFGFIQYHAYGTGTTGESSELIIGTSNDADDHVILNTPSTTGVRVRVGVSETDYPVFHDAYHPNADKWTTARTNTVTLTGDASGSGSASVDGTGNWTVSVPVVVNNDSHTHDGRYVNVTGDTMTGGLAMSGNNTVTFGPNSNWARYLTIGGNADNSTTTTASIGTTNGNLHIDAANGSFATYLNFYDGTGGVAFGGGNSTATAWMGADGDLWKGGSDNTGAKYWHAGNDGSGSGLDADLLDGHHASSTRNSANTIPVRDGSGYLNLGWINTTSGNTTSTLTDIYVNTNDGYIRKATPAHFRSQITDGVYLPISGKAADSNLLDGLDHSQFLRDDGWNGSPGQDANSQTTMRSDFTYSNNAPHTGELIRFGASGYSLQLNSSYNDATNRLSFRTYNNDSAKTWNAWRQIWHDGNDGSGSGLDADLLDGQQGSYYAPASHNHSGVYLPISGKAADSELLDGVDITRIVHGNGVNRTDAGDPNTLRPSGFYENYQGNSPTSTWYNYINMRHTNAGNGHGHQIAGSFYSAGDIYNRSYSGSGTFTGWAKLWNTANDGSGSGLDADLLDGQHGSYYAPASSIGNGTVTITTSGSASGGGTFTLNQSGNTTINISATDTNSTYNFSGSAFESRNTGNPVAIDSAITNMSGYVTSSSAAGYADGGAWVAAYSGSWVAQIFQNFRNGEITTRGKNNGTWQSWRKQWDSLNDGSGSGLDADLLDGQHASAFLSSADDSEQTANFGLVYWNEGAAKINSDPRINESGYDSDSVNIHWWTTTAAGANYGRVGHALYNGSAYQYLHTKSAQAHLYHNNNKIWTSGNDGSGSGLDADLLDGQHGSYYTSTYTAAHVGLDTSGSTSYPRMFARNNPTGSGDWLRVSTTGGGLLPYSNGNSYIGTSSWKFSQGWFNSLNGGTAWTSVNDGSGSGLDADLLDGKDHTNFGATLATYGTTAGSSGRIRCTAPFTTNSGRMFQVTVSLYSSYTCHTYVVSGYLYPTTNQWYVTKAIYTGTGTPDIFVGRDANGKAYISIANASYTGVRVHNMTMGYQTSLADTYAPWTITVNSGTENSTGVTVSKVWHSTNDGSGSGLDADLLDGQHASAFAPASHSHSYLPLTGGTITGSLTSSGYNTVSFYAGSFSALTVGSKTVKAAQDYAAGAVGSYCWAMEMANNRTARNLGNTLAGSGLRPASVLMSNSPAVSTTIINRAGIYAPGSDDNAVLAGTWRLMSAYADSYTYNDYPMALWLRIS